MNNKIQVLVLGAGFGGLEITSILSKRLGSKLDLTLIDQNDSFFFGYSKLDIIFDRKPGRPLKHAYRSMDKAGVRFRQETIKAIDPESRRVHTDHGIYQADIIVLALGADYDVDATPGLTDAGFEFYSYNGATRLGEALPSFKMGHALVGVCGFPFKCPPAPSETALLLDAYLRLKGLRESCQISLVLPFELPIPPSIGASKALLKAFQERKIQYIPEIMVASLHPKHRTAELDDGREIPFDLFLGIPEHRVPRVVEESGLVFDEWVPVDKNNMKTKYPGVYAIGDVSNAGTPKSGLFAMGEAKAAAESIIAEFLGHTSSHQNPGKASCYMEFGYGKVGHAAIDFYSGPQPTGTFEDASIELASEKAQLEEQLISRWFGK